MHRRLTSATETGLQALAMLWFLPMLTACSADSPTSLLRRAFSFVASVSISAPSPVTSPLVFTNWRRHFSVLATDSAGRPVTGVPVSWTSSAPRVAGVTPDGTVIPRRYGEADISARVWSARATAHLIVEPPVDTDLTLIAHRGFASVFPENTLVAINGAYDLGADGVETDVRLTRDGVPIIMHDETVDRTTNGSGAVAGLTLAQIQRLDACSKFGAGTTHCPVPTLDAVLKAARGRTKLLLHLQGAYPTAGLRNVAQMIREAQLGDQVIVIDFDHAQLQQLHLLDPSIAIGFLYSAVPPLSELPSGFPDAVLLPGDSLLAMGAAARDYVRSAKAQGVDVAAWTIDSQSKAQALLALGNLRILTDILLDKRHLR